MAIYRGPGGSGDATGDAANQAALAIQAAQDAANSAQEADSSASSALSSATSAATSATNAATSASSAASSASSASSSASSASTSASNAATSETNTANLYDQFDDRYLGTKSSDPTLDNDGNALLEGALYWNTSTKRLKIYNGTTWENTANPAGTGTVTSVDMSVPTGLTVSGNPITNSGTLAVSYASGYSIPTTTKQGQWDTAYGWGNHATAGYLTSLGIGSLTQAWDADLDAIAALSGTSGLLKKTAANTWTLDTNTYLTSYTETDPIYVASSWYSTTNNSSNWNTAYSWGNHASAGYLTSSAIGSSVLAYDSNLQSFVNTFTLPTTDGTNGQVLTTNGSGTLTFSTPSTVASLDDLTDVVITSPSTNQVLQYNGTNWVNATGGGGSMVYPSAGIAVSTGSAWGTSLTAPTGTIVGTTDTQTLTNKTLDGANNTFSNISNSSLSNSSITINGTSVSLGGAISVGTVTSVAALTLGTTGTDLSSTVANGTTTPVITLNVPTASATNRGALSSSDWSTFNNKQAALVSGTNIKTVNGVSLLGSGDLGTIGVAYGGTGQTSYTDGQLLIGNSSGNTLTKATLTAGSGVSITNGNGSITIATTGGGSGGMTLLGTVTASGNSVSLGSLTLTGYSALFIAVNAVSIATNAQTVVWVTSDNTQAGGSCAITSSTGSETTSGLAWIDLNTGVIGGATRTSGGSTAPNAGKTNVSTSTTTLYFRLNGTASFDAGSFRVYGVA